VPAHPLPSPDLSQPRLAASSIHRRPLPVEPCVPHLMPPSRVLHCRCQLPPFPTTSPAIRLPSCETRLLSPPSVPGISLCSPTTPAASTVFVASAVLWVDGDEAPLRRWCCTHVRLHCRKQSSHPSLIPYPVYHFNLYGKISSSCVLILQDLLASDSSSSSTMSLSLSLYMFSSLTLYLFFLMYIVTEQLNRDFSNT
jgi:hypothetical protein